MMHCTITGDYDILRYTHMQEGEAIMPKTITTLQDTILNTVRKEKIPCTVHLTNGLPLKGIIRGFDNFVVVLDSDGKQMMVFKHAISTVTPSRPIQYEQADAERYDE